MAIIIYFCKSFNFINLNFLNISKSINGIKLRFKLIIQTNKNNEMISSLKFL
jgi:hypothetical protein